MEKNMTDVTNSAPAEETVSTPVETTAPVETTNATAPVADEGVVAAEESTEVTASATDTPAEPVAE